jgi:DNA-binding Xre family transcriptional regulator
MKEIRWRLGAHLQEQNITAYRLAQQLKKRVSRNTVYAIARGEAKGVQFDTLAAVWEVLERESGKPIALTDLLEVFERPVELPTENFVEDATEDALAHAWMNSDVSHLEEFEPWDWGEFRPEQVGLPIQQLNGRYVVVGTQDG